MMNVYRVIDSKQIVMITVLPVMLIKQIGNDE
jgi:hypothetical protein